MKYVTMLVCFKSVSYYFFSPCGKICPLAVNLSKQVSSCCSAQSDAISDESALDKGNFVSTPSSTVHIFI